jgi:hypothetical protein
MRGVCVVSHVHCDIPLQNEEGISRSKFQFPTSSTLPPLQSILFNESQEDFSVINLEL